MRSPVIGISGRRTTTRRAPERGARPAASSNGSRNVELDVFDRGLARRVYQAGGMPVYLPIDVDALAVIQSLDGLLVTGGADFGSSSDEHVRSGELHPRGDSSAALEYGLLDNATARALPVLGIGDGLQSINVHGGGTLHDGVALDGSGNGKTYGVVIAADSTLNRVYGDTHEVKSSDCRPIDLIAPDFLATAYADDGQIKAIEHTELPILAVQWQPERVADPIFGWLIEATR